MAKTESRLKKSSTEIDELVREYMPLVNQIARRYARFRPDLVDDLVQVGAMGLLKAINYYDPTRSRTASMKTLAACYIKGEIRHFLRDQSSLVQVPRKYSEISTLLSKLEESLSKEFDRSPTVQELAERSGYSVQEICDALQSLDVCAHYESFDSGDDHDEADDARTLTEVVADKRYQDFVLASEDRELIAQALKGLGDKTYQVFEFVFFYDLTQKEAAKKLGLSEMVVSRSVKSGLTKLKEILVADVL